MSGFNLKDCLVPLHLFTTTAREWLPQKSFSVSSKSAHRASVYLVFLKQTQKHCRLVGSQVTLRHHLSFCHLQSQTCHAHQPQDLMKYTVESVCNIYIDIFFFCRLPIFKLSLSVTKYDNIFIIAHFI